MHPFLQLSHKYKDSPSDVLALLVFSFCFTNKNKDLMQTHPKLKVAAEKFYYLLKNAKALPQIHEDMIRDVRNELEYQTSLKDIFSGRDPLLEEFEELDSTLKEIAFNPKMAEKKLKEHKSYGFKSLKIGNGMGTIFCDKTMRKPIDLAKTLESSLGSQALKTVLISYMNVNTFSNEEEAHAYYNYLLNLITMLISPRAELDAETEYLSLFNTKNEEIRNLVTFVINQLNFIGKEKAEALDAEPIKKHYLKAIYTLITHAKVEKPNYSYSTPKNRLN